MILFVVIVKHVDLDLEKILLITIPYKIYNDDNEPINDLDMTF